MAYTRKDFKSKAAVKRAIAAGERIECYQPGPFGQDQNLEGLVYLEGPHCPKPHTWYGQGTIKNGFLIKIT